MLAYLAAHWTAHRNEHGATAVEYALLVAGVAAMIFFAVLLKDTLTLVFESNPGLECPTCSTP